LQVSASKPTSDDDDHSSNGNDEAQDDDDDIYCADEDNLEQNGRDSSMDLQKGDNIDFNMDFAVPNIDEASPSEDEAAALAALRHRPEGLVPTLYIIKY
jgi:hypothetical protein